MGYTKIIQYGNVTEVYNYEKSHKTETSSSRKARLRKHKNRLYHAVYGTSDVKKDRAKRAKDLARKKGIYKRSDASIRRSKTNFFRLCHHNNVSADTINFITLTFLEDHPYEKTLLYVKIFFNKLRESYSERPISYIAVPELTKKGRFHFHLLVYDLPSNTAERERETRNVQRQFQRGYVDVRPATYTSKGIAGYMAKYMAKALSDEKYGAIRGYNCSRNIKKVTTYGSNSLSSYASLIIPTENVAEIEEASYDVPYLGTCSFKKITKKL